MPKIETGVDKLVEIIGEKGSISVEEAAKKLGVSEVVVQEWADFLEEEKIISIEYKFSKTILAERKLSQKEIKVKEKEFHNEKDAFVRRVDSYISSLDTEAMGLKKVKEEFDTLKREIGDELEKVKKEATELDKYDSLQKNLAKDILNQREEYRQIIERSHTQISAEEKRYQVLLNQLEIEKREFVMKEQRMRSLEQREAELKQRLKAIYDLVKSAEQNIDGERHSIISEEEKLSNFQKIVEQIEEDLAKKKKEMEPMVQKAKEHELEIQKIQEDILNKVTAKSERIKAKVQESEYATENFKRFFERKTEIEKMLLRLEEDRLGLKQEFEGLIKKATAFNLASKSDTIDGHVKELNKELTKLDKRHDNFKGEMQKLIKVIKQ